MKSECLLVKSLYDYDSIMTAVEAYRRLAGIKIQDSDLYWRCVFLDCKYDPEMTIKEFENYVIAVSVQRHDNM